MASDAVKKYWYVFIFVTFVMVFLFKRYKKTEKGRANLDAIKLKIPIFGTLFHKTALSRFSSTAGDAAAFGRSDPAGAGHRGGHGQQRGDVEGGRRRAGERP